MAQPIRRRSEFLPFSPPLVGPAEWEEVLDTLRSDWITTGPKTKRFEAEFAGYVGASEALAMSSCTDALQVALAALGIGRGDAVFTTTMTFCSTVHVISHLAATPVLVDVDHQTLNLDAGELRKSIERVTTDGRLTPRAIVPVHYAGLPCDMEAIDALAAEFGLDIVEDAAHAFPASVDGRSIGDPLAPAGVVRATAFSFYATKNLTTGEGGMLTGPPDFLDEARLWALHGMSSDSWNRYGKGGSWFYEVVRPGFKCNMTDIQAALGLHQLEQIADFQTRRAAVARRYDEAFADVAPIETPTTTRPGATSALHLYPIRLRLAELRIDRAMFIEELAARNIGASVHFIPVHRHPYYRSTLGYRDTDLPTASGEFERLVSLPLNPRLNDDDVEDVVAAVRDIISTHAA